jgi:hypothetical protein
MNNRYTIEQVRDYIEYGGYVLLSTDYESSNSILEIECPQGHRCDKTFNSFKSGQRCAECSGNVKYTIEQVREYVENEGYTLLSTEYEGAKSILEIECPFGHRCDKTFGNFKRGSRCAECRQ